jgi:hypothetical protein
MKIIFTAISLFFLGYPFLTRSQDALPEIPRVPGTEEIKVESDDEESFDVLSRRALHTRNSINGTSRDSLDSILEQVRPTLEVECKPMQESVCSAPDSTGFENLTPLSDFFTLFNGTNKNVSSQTDIPNSRSAQCQCIQEQIGPKVPAAEKKAEIERLKAAVRKEAGKKVLNDYTSHFEDVRFYVANAAQIFHKKEERWNQEATQISCRSADKILEAVNNHSGCKELPSEVQDERLNGILRSFGSQLERDFQGNLRSIQQQILSESANPKYSGPESEKRKRTDRALYTMLMDSEDFKIVNRVLTKVLKNPLLKEKLNAKMLTSSNTPQHEMFTALESEFFSSDKTKLNSFFDIETLGPELHAKFSASVRENKPQSFYDELKAMISVAADQHPGVGRLMTSKELFRNSMFKIGRSQDAVAFLESDKTMKSHFEENCGNVIKNFAEVVCSTDDALMSNVNQEELEKIILLPPASLQRIQTQALVLCEETKSLSSLNSPFLLSPHDRKSSYNDLINPTSDPSVRSIVREAQTNPSSAAGRALARSEKAHVDPGHTVRNDTFAKEVFEADMPKSQSNLAASPAIAPVKSPVVSDKNLENTVSQSADLRQEVVPEQSLYNNNGVTPQAINSNISSSKIENSKEMREFLADETAKEPVTKLVDDSSDDVMKELIRLKEETEKNKLRILELSSDNQKLKLQASEAALNKLQKERAALNPGEPVVDEPVELTKKDKIFQPSTLRENSRDVASATSSETGSANAGTSSGSQVSASSQGSLGGLNRALLASSGLRGGVDTNERVVVSSATTRTASLEIKSQDVGLDLLNYISSNDADIQTLIKLKTSGIMYKYKVVENGEVVEKEMLIDYQNLNEDVKKIIDRKISQNKDRNSEVARLDKEIKDLKRVYSYSALKIILGEQMKK